jgi:hypothetical protein
LLPPYHSEVFLMLMSKNVQLKETGLNQNNQQQQIDMESICNWLLEHFYFQTSKILKTLHNEWREWETKRDWSLFGPVTRSGHDVDGLHQWQIYLKRGLSFNLQLCEEVLHIYHPILQFH